MSERADASCLVELPYGEDFDWGCLLDFMAPRLIPGVEAIAENRYRRTFRLADGGSGWFEVADCPQEHALRLRIVTADEQGSLPQIVQRVRAMFDLDADMRPIRRALGKDPLLRPAVAAHPGMRLPGAWDPFEFTVRAILGQQITVKAATTLAGRLPLRCQTACAAGSAPGLTNFFPTAGEIRSADLSGLGITTRRLATIQGFATSVSAGEVSLEAGQGLEAFVASLTALPGIGPWTAHYVAMRALKMSDAFPESDLGVRKALAIGGRLPTPAQAADRAEAWRPWRAYATLYLWKGAALPR